MGNGFAGEVPWVKQMVVKHHEAAAAKGVRIVPCCELRTDAACLPVWLRPPASAAPTANNDSPLLPT